MHFCFKPAEQLGAFAAGVKQMLEDVQERLVYRTHIYIQTDISGYKPAPGDLAYPDKLVMMEVGLLVDSFTHPHTFGYFIPVKIGYFFLILIQDAKSRETCHEILGNNIFKKLNRNDLLECSFFVLQVVFYKHSVQLSLLFHYAFCF